MVEIALPITILMMMPVILRPPNAPPLFGGKSVILFGGIDKEAMRRWQERLRAAKDRGATLNHPNDNNGDEPAEARKSPDER
jgi:hypothetical protein